MPIQERKNKHGKITSYRVYWNNPITKKKETKSFKEQGAAKEFDSEVQHRIKFKPDSFKPVENPKDKDAGIEYFQDLVMKYLKEHPMAESTKKNVPHHYFQWEGIMGNMLIQDIDHDALRKFERESRKRKAKQTTIHRRVTIVRAALNWGVREGVIPGHNIHGYQCEKGQNQTEAPPTVDELKAMIAVAPLHLARAIKLSINLACRVGSSELLKLEWDHFNLEEGFVYVPEAKKNKHKKRGAGRKVPLFASFLAELKEWKAEDDKGKRKMNRKTGEYEYDGKPIPWPIHRNGRRVEGQFLKAWHTARVAAKIKRVITPYDLRHASITMLLEQSDYDYKLVEEISGTSAVTLMRNYQHVTEAQKRNVLGKLPSL